MNAPRSLFGMFGAFWGVAGVVLLLASATYRLTPLAVEASMHPFSWHHWAALIAVVSGMAYAEGYRGFQQGFSPRVAARARYLAEHPRPVHVLLAPLFCMGYIHATRRRRITSLSLTLAIIVLILLVRFVSQPWRGIIDAGVVVGLAWGIISLLVFAVVVFRSAGFRYSPEVPEGK